MQDILHGTKVKMIEWKECEHEAAEMAALHDPTSIQALINYDLLKFFHSHSMHRQSTLLDYLV